MSNVEMAARVHLSQVRAFDMIRRLVHRETLPVTAAPILKSELSIQRSHHGRKSVPNLHDVLRSRPRMLPCGHTLCSGCLGEC